MDGTIHFARCWVCGSNLSNGDQDLVSGWVDGHHKVTGHTLIDVWSETPRHRVEFDNHRHAGWGSEDDTDDARIRACCQCGWRSGWHTSRAVNNRALGAHIAEVTCQKT